MDRLAKENDRNAGKLDGLPPGDYLMPLYNVQNQVIGMERPVAPDQLEGLQKDTHLGRMLGVWMGRILEEDSANRFNTELVQTAFDIWDKRKPNETNTYVNVADPKITDPVIKDAWDTLGWKFKAEAENIFGAPDTFMVRKDMVDDMIGENNGWKDTPPRSDRTEGPALSLMTSMEQTCS